MDDWEQRAETESLLELRRQVEAAQEKIARMSPEERAKYEELRRIANSANPPNPLGKAPEQGQPCEVVSRRRGNGFWTGPKSGYPTTATTIVREGKDPLGHSN